jgi:membrane protein implicated in regulation of membrane protease activity
LVFHGFVFFHVGFSRFKCFFTKSFLVLAVFVSVVFVGFGVLGIALLFFELGFRLENERKNKEGGEELSGKRVPWNEYITGKGVKVRVFTWSKKTHATRTTIRCNRGRRLKWYEE